MHQSAAANQDADTIEVEEWQLEGIDRAIVAADAGQFASEAEVRAAFDAFKRKQDMQWSQ